MIATSGAVTSTRRYGIQARQEGTGGIHVEAKGTVMGDQGGIVGYAAHSGRGITVTASGPVSAANGPGIHFYENWGGPIRIEAKDAVTSGQTGIYAGV